MYFTATISIYFAKSSGFGILAFSFAVSEEKSVFLAKSPALGTLFSAVGIQLSKFDSIIKTLSTYF